jgi:hypothetical protein
VYTEALAGLLPLVSGSGHFGARFKAQLTNSQSDFVCTEHGSKPSGLGGLHIRVRRFYSACIYAIAIRPIGHVLTSLGRKVHVSITHAPI